MVGQMLLESQGKVADVIRALGAASRFAGALHGGSNSPMRIPMIVITTSNSTRVNALPAVGTGGNSSLPYYRVRTRSLPPPAGPPRMRPRRQTHSGPAAKPQRSLADSITAAEQMTGHS